ncbi:MAG: hypothetical protein GY854_30090 [Deltaproteobacteria bacterium]|nr:hypothetical protein [Deltaproteobacteria bacterium]
MRTILFSLFFFSLSMFGCAPSKGGAEPTLIQNLELGDDCTGEDSKCGTDLVCSGADDTEGTCQWNNSPGTKKEGDSCNASWECAFGVSCASDGLCRSDGAPGTVPSEGACTENTDCQLFLTCEDGICTGFQPPFWKSPCVEPDEEVATKIYFDIGRTAGEFYRFPFPNDVDMQGGHIDLTGHPDPGEIIPELGNAIDDYIELVENDLDGFGTQSHVYFRFNRWPNEKTMKNGENLYIVNIDPESEKYKEKAWNRFQANSARGLYICHNWLAIGPSLGRPLLPGTTYAAVVTNDILATNGTPVQPDDDFPAMLSDTKPSNAGLASVWSIYEPLRVYLKEEGIDPSSIVAASVFTTGNPAAKIPKIREAVRSSAAPTVSELKNESGSGYTLYTGKLAVPFYQKGTRPFAGVEDGGAIEYDANGLPVLVETEQVKLALMVPDGDAPASGWPIILYAHGTEGDELSFLDSIAAKMAGINAAVISLEHVQHGDRRGLSAADAELGANSPDALFYNLKNPRAARDNKIQSAADYFQLTRLVEDFETITGESVTFDPARIFFYGHSQETHGQLLFATHEPLVKGVILSGTGGNFMSSLLAKKNSYDLASATNLILMDVNLDYSHPMLNLIQAAFDPVDPANHARYVYRNSFGNLVYPKRHVFMSYGVGDTYSPESTQSTLARVLGLVQWPTSEHQIDAVQTIDSLPHTSTIYVGSVGVTIVVVIYEPSAGQDGHFVMFENPNAISQSTEFIRTMIEEGVPTLAKP